MKIKLQESEQILFEGKPAEEILIMWIFTKVIPYCLFVGLISFYLLMLGWLFFVVIPLRLKNPAFPIFIIQLAGLTVPLWAIFFVRYYKSLKETFHYYITGQRCIFEGGIIVRRVRSVPYHKITDVEINQNIIEQFLGIYSLKIFTPGTGSMGMPGFEKAEIIFYGLKDAEHPADIIQETLKKYKATGE